MNHRSKKLHLRLFGELGDEHLFFSRRRLVFKREENKTNERYFKKLNLYKSIKIINFKKLLAQKKQQKC